MLNPKYKAYADRLRELIDEGNRVAGLEKGYPQHEAYIQGKDKIDLHAWISKVDNILRLVFGEGSAHFIHYDKLTYKTNKRYLEHAHEIYPIVGVLRGALDDLERGFLLKQEFIISAALFDDLLSQARHLNDSGYKDPAAVLARVVLEDALRKIARELSIDDSTKVSVINDELKKAGRYNQPQWRIVQSWLDIGNAAAHGKFDQFTQDNVSRLIEDVERFLAVEFRSI